MIGDTLRKEREKQKLSIQDVEKGTSIRPLYIEALEKGEYDKLPGEVYAKGFIKNYGNFLNLSGEELVRQFIMEISPATTTPEDVPHAKENQKTNSNEIAAKDVGAKYRPKQSTNNENSYSDFNKRNYMVAAVALIVFLIGGVVYSFSGNGSENPEVVQTETKINPVESKTDTQATPAETQTQPATQDTKTPQNPAPAPVPQPQIVAQNLNLQATFSGDCWTRVITDGKMAFEGMINAGQTLAWEGNNSVSVLLGNAGAVQLVMNGQSIGALGADGDVVEKTFTR